MTVKVSSHYFLLLLYKRKNSSVIVWTFLEIITLTSLEM